MKDIRFNVHRSLIDRQKFEITMFYKKRVYNGIGYYWIITEVSGDEMLALLGLDKESYKVKALEYGAEVKYNKYIHIETILFLDKRSARFFIKEYFINRVIPLLLLSKS